MSGVSSSYGHLGEDGYKKLSREELVPLGDEGSLSFTSSLLSIETEKKVSFLYAKGKESPKKFSIEIGKNTPLFSQIQKIPKEDPAKRAVAIKALLVKYVATLLNVEEVFQGKCKEVAAKFEEGQCRSVLVGEKKNEETSSEGGSETGFREISVSSCQERLSRLASGEKLEKTVAKVLFPEKIYDAKREIQEKASSISVPQEDVESKIGGDLSKLQVSMKEREIEEYRGKILSMLDEMEKAEQEPIEELDIEAQGKISGETELPPDLNEMDKVEQEFTEEPDIGESFEKASILPLKSAKKSNPSNRGVFVCEGEWRRSIEDNHSVEVIDSKFEERDFEDPNTVVLFGENLSDSRRPEKENRALYGGQATLFGPEGECKNEDQTGSAVGIITTEIGHLSLEDQKKIIDRNFEPLKKFVRSGGKVKVPVRKGCIQGVMISEKEGGVTSEKEHFFVHNLGTGYGDCSKKILLYIQKKIDELTQIKLEDNPQVNPQDRLNRLHEELVEAHRKS